MIGVKGESVGLNGCVCRYRVGRFVMCGFVGGDGGGGRFFDFFQTRDEFGGRRLGRKNEAFCR